MGKRMPRENLERKVETQAKNSPINSIYTATFTYTPGVVPFKGEVGIDSVTADNVDEALMKVLQNGCKGMYGHIERIAIISPKPADSLVVKLRYAPDELHLEEIDPSCQKVVRSQTLREMFRYVKPEAAYKWHANLETVWMANNRAD